uniref:Glucose-methanol-choline oxidoreductase N-terminal domain-containing protein n=1 Tax=Timema tahoe TaxID=61484 RepID=A0A7R9NYD0_9NEOP|nr:unnamed protein product [Timema tahoe]
MITGRSHPPTLSQISALVTSDGVNDGMEDSGFCSLSAGSQWTSSCGAGVSSVSAALFTNLIAALLDSHKRISDTSIYPKDTDIILDQYDFIVVGAGSAGSVLANRLTEVPEWKVLLLEAGGDPTLESEIPPLFHHTQGTEIDWKYKTVPQEHGCLGMVNKSCIWPRGKVLGGSSALNSLLYVRGNRYDYDHWEDMGNTGWGFKDVLPYFKKSEDLRSVDLEDLHKETLSGYSKRFHNKGGYLTLEQSPTKPPIVDGLIAAAKEMGFKVGDSNGESQRGFTLQHGTVRDGRRCSTGKAFLSPAKDRENLHVVKYAHVTKVLIDPDTKLTHGVEFLKNGKIHLIHASKEVVLSAGSVNSPQLLILSGIGPAEHLKELGIPLVQELNVGENLQDHLQFLGPVILFNKTNPQGLDPKKLLDDTYQYFMHGTGPLASLDILQLQGFISTKFADKGDYPKDAENINDLDYPDIQFQHIRFAFNDTESTKRVASVSGYTDEIYQALLGIPNSKAEIYVPLPFLQRPKSKGVIKLRSKDPFDQPIIDPKYLSHPQDVETFVEGVKFAADLARTKALAEGFEAEVSTTRIPGCPGEHGSNEYWACVVRKVATTTYHPVGTCKMGPASDSTAVVDPRLKVYGIKGLRVVDGSIIPKIISGNINAPIIMIERMKASKSKDHFEKMHMEFVGKDIEFFKRKEIGFYRPMLFYHRALVAVRNIFLKFLSVRLTNRPGYTYLNLSESAPSFAMRVSGEPLVKNNTLSTPDRDSNSDLTLPGNQTYCESDTLDHSITEADFMVVFLPILVGIKST